MKLDCQIRHFAIKLSLLTVLPALAWPQNPCDLNLNGTVDAGDVQVGANMVIGASACTANIEGAGICNAAILQRVINTYLGGTCHTAFLSWTASTSTNVVGYNVYRASASGGPYTKLNTSPVVGVAYTDRTVLAGQTYYYVATAVDGSNAESTYSNQAQAVVPSP